MCAAVRSVDVLLCFTGVDPTSGARAGIVLLLLGLVVAVHRVPSATRLTTVRLRHQLGRRAPARRGRPSLRHGRVTSRGGAAPRSVDARHLPRSVHELHRLARRRVGPRSVLAPAARRRPRAVPAAERHRHGRRRWRWSTRTLAPGSRLAGSRRARAPSCSASPRSGPSASGRPTASSCWASRSRSGHRNADDGGWPAWASASPLRSSSAPCSSSSTSRCVESGARRGGARERCWSLSAAVRGHRPARRSRSSGSSTYCPRCRRGRCTRGTNRSVAWLARTLTGTDDLWDRRRCWVRSTISASVIAAARAVRAVAHADVTLRWIPLELGALILVILVAGPLSWDHYFVWAAIPLVAMIDARYWRAGEPATERRARAHGGGGRPSLREARRVPNAASVRADWSLRLTTTPYALGGILLLVCAVGARSDAG